MRSYHQYTSILFLSIISVLYVFQGCDTENPNLIIASVGDKLIYQTEFIDRYENYLEKTGIQDNIVSRKEILNSMISETLLYDYDTNQAIFENREYLKEMQWTKNQVLLAYLKDREIYQKLEVTDKEIREAFLRSNQKIAARHLFAMTEDEINDIAQLLKIGVDFNTLAKQSFTDSTLKNNGGYLGYFSWGDMEPEFEDKAFSMKIGEISDPVKLKNGYSIIKVEDKATIPIITENQYLNKKEKFAQILRIRKKKPSENKFMNDAVDFSEIKFTEEQIDQIWNEIELNVKSNEVRKSTLENTTAVEYKGKEYTSLEIMERIESIPYYHLKKLTSKDKLIIFIKGLILQEKLLEIADRNDYANVDVVKSKMKVMKTSLFMKYKISEIIEKSTINDSLMYNYYISNPDLFSTHDKINVQEILVKDLQLAKSIINDIKQGKNFGELAKVYSIRKSTAENNGIIGLTPVARFGNLQKTFKSCKLNELIGPIEIENIYGIFKVIDRVGSELQEYENVKDVAATAVKYNYKAELVNNYVQVLKQKIDVKINMKNLGSSRIFYKI